MSSFRVAFVNWNSSKTIFLGDETNQLRVVLISPTHESIWCWIVWALAPSIRIATLYKRFLTNRGARKTQLYSRKHIEELLRKRSLKSSFMLLISDRTMIYLSNIITCKLVIEVICVSWAILNDYNSCSILFVRPSKASFKLT